MSSIADSSSEANAYTFNTRISFASWSHVSQTSLREARIYDAEDQDLERAYVSYSRFCDLISNKSRTHSGFTTNKTQYKRAYNQLPVAIERSESSKKRILERRKNAPAKVSGQSPQFIPSADSSPTKAAPNAKKSSTLEEELELYANAVDDPQKEVQFDPNTIQAGTIAAPRSIRSIQVPSLVDVPQYPSLDSQRVSRLASLSPSPVPTSSEVFSNDKVPASIPSTAVNERGESSRHVFVPKTLRDEFLKIAGPNTRSNLETCGMSCGKLERNAFFVTDSLIPHQVSTPDTCATTNEEESFEYVDQRDSFSLGWIHTHPSQSCFMSSVDSHTHASYQSMSPEAIAIVCAPAHEPSWAAFRLTDPPGIPVIRSCKLTGFHPHENADSSYKSASRPGHYQEIASSLVTTDSRTKAVEN